MRLDDHKAAFLRALGIDNRAGRQDYQVSTVSSVRDHPPPWPAGDVCDHSARPAGTFARAYWANRHWPATSTTTAARLNGLVTADDDAHANVALRGGTAIDCAWDL